jgi:ABC-type lipoprotein release transport system permease subunit
MGRPLVNELRGARGQKERKRAVTSQHLKKGGLGAGKVTHPEVRLGKNLRRKLS